MHIPDGYLSPQTAGVMYVAAAPFIIRATRKLKQTLNQRVIPLISIFSAFCFVVMMFNIPLPGGTTGHAVGAVIAAITIGPWAAILSLTVALTIQALFFGDGGILALGANVFNMAVVMPLVGYLIYMVLNRGNSSSRQKIITAALAGYIAINTAALLTAVELGLQPLLFKDNLGHALYFPYGLKISISAMMLGHLTLAGIAEALVTGLMVGWILRMQPQLLTVKAQKTLTSSTTRWGWFALLIAVLLTPIGLLPPGTAWGEWGREELAKLGLGYIPAGFDRWSAVWRAPLPDYKILGLGSETVAYVISAVVGVAVSVGVIFLLLGILNKLNASRKKSTPVPENPDLIEDE